MKCVHAWFLIKHELHDLNYAYKVFLLFVLQYFFRPGFNCQSEANIPLVIEKYTSKSAIYLQLDKKQATIVIGGGVGGRCIIND